jgi:hypothetical protein
MKPSYVAYIHPSRLPCHLRLYIKCTLIQALRLCTGSTAHRRSRIIALLIHDHGTRRGWRVSVTPWPLFTPGKNAVPIVQEAGWATRPVWTGAENLAPTGIRSPDSPASSQSLYFAFMSSRYLLIWNPQNISKYVQKQTLFLFWYKTISITNKQVLNWTSYLE